MSEVNPLFERLPRVEIDPNITAGEEGDFSVVWRAGFDLAVQSGDRVVVVQRDDTGPDFVGYAQVVRISELGLVYLKVDWSSFRDDVQTQSSASSTQPQPQPRHRPAGRLVGASGTVGVHGVPTVKFT